MSKTFAIILMGRIFQVLIAFVALKVVTNYLSSTNVAYYFLFLSLMNYFGLALISPAGQYVNRQLHLWKEEKVVLNRLFGHGLYVLGVSLLAIPLVFFASSLGLLEGLSGWELSLMIGLAVFSNTLITTLVPTLNMFNYRLSFVFFTVAWLLLSLLLSVFFVWWVGESVFVWFAGQIISQILFSLIAIVLFKRYLCEDFSITSSFQSMSWLKTKEVLRFAFPLLVSTFLLWMATDSFRFVLEKTHGLEYVALFSVGFAISQRFSYAIEAIAQQVYYPDYYAKMNASTLEERSQAWQKMFYSSLPLYFVTTLGTIILAPWLIRLFSGPQYISAVPFVIGGAIFNLFRKISASFSMLAHSERKTSLLVIPYLVGAIFSSVILYFLKQSSFYTPAFILVIGSFFMCLIMVWKTRSLIVWRKECLKEIFAFWCKYLC